MKTAFVAFACLVASLALAPAARADSGFDACAAAEDVVTSALTTSIDDSHSMDGGKTGVTQSDISYASRSYETERRDIAHSCKSTSHLATYYLALMTAFESWIDHFTGADPQGVELEKGVQRLTICASAYFGSDEGATCARLQKKFIGFQSAWDAASGQ